MNAYIRRLAMNPRMSCFITVGSLSTRRPSSCARRFARAVVFGPGTISKNRVIHAGSAQCITTNRPGCFLPFWSRATGKLDVLDATTARGESTVSNSSKIRCFSARSSLTDSITNGQPARSLREPVIVSRSDHFWRRPLGMILRRTTSRMCPVMFFRAVLARAAVRLYATTFNPCAIRQVAIPCPISPRPTSPTGSICDAAGLGILFSAFPTRPD